MGLNKVKICGIKHTQNINSISLLKPNFIGVIFYPYSSRFIGLSFPIERVPIVKKVGVFVNNSIESLLKKLQQLKYVLEFLQLHGYESIDNCEELYKNNVSFIKVIRVNEAFYVIQTYTNYNLYFLFDTYCKEYGGSGRKFSWERLSEYIFDTRFFLSGGIGRQDVERIKKFFHTNFLGTDLNSNFETEPGNKNRDELRRFIQKINL